MTTDDPTPIDRLLEREPPTPGLATSVRAVLEVARQTVRLVLQDRFAWLCIALQPAAAAFAFALGIAAPSRLDGEAVFSIVAWWVVANMLLPWTTMYFAIRAVHGDVEDRTLQYLLVRPVSRTAILVGKLLGVCGFAGTCHLAGMALVYGALRLHAERWPDDAGLWPLPLFLAATAMLVVAYATVGALFAAAFRHPLIWSLAFIVGGQMLLANLPAKASIRHATIADPVRRFVLDGLDPGPSLARSLWPAERDWDRQLVGSPIQDLLQVTGVALLLAIVVYTRSEYDSRARE